MNKLIEFIAYKGDAFTIEWYFDEYDHSEALEYYNQLGANERIQLLKLFKRMGMLEKSMTKQNFGSKKIKYMPLNPTPIATYGDAGEIHDKTKFRLEEDKVYAFKPHPDRFLCFFYEGKKIIVTNGFRKKQQKLPIREKENALNKRDSYITRVKSGEYYD